MRGKKPLNAWKKKLVARKKKKSGTGLESIEGAVSARKGRLTPTTKKGENLEIPREKTMKGGKGKTLLLGGGRSSTGGWVKDSAQLEEFLSLLGLGKIRGGVEGGLNRRRFSPEWQASRKGTLGVKGFLE